MYTLPFILAITIILCARESEHHYEHRYNHLEPFVIFLFSMVFQAMPICIWDIWTLIFHFTALITALILQLLYRYLYAKKHPDDIPRNKYAVLAMQNGGILLMSSIVELITRGPMQ